MPVDETTIAHVLFRQRIPLLAYIEAIVRDEHVAEDVFQDVCALAIAKRDVIDDEDHLRKWVRKTARFRASYAMRKRRNLVFNDEVLDQLESQWDAVEGDLASDMSDALRKCMGKLSPYARTLLNLRYDEGISGERLARAVNRKVNAVYVALSRIHRTLNQCIRKVLDKPFQVNPREAGNK